MHTYGFGGLANISLSLSASPDMNELADFATVLLFLSIHPFTYTHTHI